MIKLARNFISGKRNNTFPLSRAPSSDPQLEVKLLFPSSVFTCPGHTYPAATNLAKHTVLSADIIQIVVLCWDTVVHNQALCVPTTTRTQAGKYADFIHR